MATEYMTKVEMRLTFTATATWLASHAYALGDYVHPTTLNSYHYKCTTAGTSGATEPTWDTTPGGTTNDGTVVWTTIAGNEVRDGHYDSIKIALDNAVADASVSTGEIEKWDEEEVATPVVTLANEVSVEY